MEGFADNSVIPKITDLQSGLKLLVNLPNDPAQQSSALENFLDSLQKDPPSQPVYFALLEKARAPIAVAIEALARQYSNRFLPLDDFEEVAFQIAVRLWRKMANGYSWCLKNQKEDVEKEDYEGTVATLICRSMYYFGQVMNEHYRSRRELPLGIWPELHRRFLLAEQSGVTQTLVHDPLLPPDHHTFCAAIYVATLLVALGTPYRLSIRDQELAQRWASWWAPLVQLEPIGANEELPELAIDLRSDTGIKPCTNGDGQREHLRRLETARLIKKMRNAHAKLQQNIPPLQIGLGDRCTPGRARRLLKILALPWSLQTRPRRFPRYPSKGAAHVVSGFEDIHRLLSGQEFVSPITKRKTSYEPQDSSLRLFAANSLINTVDVIDRTNGTQPGQAASSAADIGDPWKIANQSASGLCLRRPTPGRKVAHNQLLAIHTEGGNAYFLAYARWIVQAQQGHLIAGIAAFPGIPRAVAVRFTIEHAGHEELIYSRAFLLPASEALNIPAMLIMQHADYQAERRIEICPVNSETVEQSMILKHVQQEGSDFEYVSFSAL